PNQPFSSYIQTHFTIDDGLSSNIIDDIVQSQDGFLWITYGNGTLGRFDGQHSTLIPVTTTVEMMAIGPNGDLWVSGIDLLQIPVAAFNQYGPFQAIVHHPDFGTGRNISCLHFGRSGILWVGTMQGLYRFEHGVFSLALPKFAIERIEESADGNLLLTTPEGLVVWDGSQAVAHPELNAELGIKLNNVFHGLEDSRGVTWICTAQGVARRTG